MDQGSRPQSALALPVMLDVAGRRCVIVGGGAVASRRAASLVECGAQVVVVAPQLDEKLDELLIERVERDYVSGDLDGAFLVVVATDHQAVNAAVAADAGALGVLVNRADDAEAGGDVTVMGHERRGPLTVAVDTGHTSAAAGKAIRAELMEQLDADWVTLLDAARPWRRQIRQAISDPTQRSARLRRLTDATAMQMLKLEGRAALETHLQRVAAGQTDSA